jgi:peptide/nickel transport system substrate-binding protein
MDRDLNYWSSKRLSRRGVLRGTGISVAGLGAAALIGCGGDDSPSTGTVAPTATAPGSGDPSGTVAPTPDGGPVSGGTLTYSSTINVDTFDALTASSFQTSYPTGYAYSRLVKYETGDGGPASGAVVPDAAESWDISNDGTTFVFKLRSGMKFDDRAPTSGREMTSEDVMQSWEKFAAGSAYRQELVNEVNSNAPVVSVEAIDDQTVRFDLAFPDAIFLSVLSHPFNFWVHPIESMNGGFDPATDMRGTGPFMMTDFRPNVGYTYERNPNYWDAPRPYLDRVQERIIADAAQVESQVRAGALDFGGVTGATAAEVLKSTSGFKPILANPGAGGAAMSFNYQGEVPWRDERVRRAFSMSIDRDSFIDAILEPSLLEDAGVNVNRYWNTPVAAGFGAYWLDPKGPDFGPAAAYLEHNIGEARALLDAAGHGSGNPIRASLLFSPQYGRDWATRCELYQSMLNQAGFQIQVEAIDYTTGWVPLYLRARGAYEAPNGGPAIQLAPHGSRSDVGQWLNVFFDSRGSNNVVGTEYPELDSMIERTRTEFDFESRIAQVHDIQRWMVDNMVAAPAGQTIDAVSVSKENLQGPDRYQIWGGSYTSFAIGTETIPYYWWNA